MLIASELNARAELDEEVQRLARVFQKGSALVRLRRLFDAKWLTSAAYVAAYARELERLMTQASDGGDFYLTLGAMRPSGFARAVFGRTKLLPRA